MNFHYSEHGRSRRTGNERENLLRDISIVSVDTSDPELQARAKIAYLGAQLHHCLQDTHKQLLAVEIPENNPLAEPVQKVATALLSLEWVWFGLVVYLSRVHFKGFKEPLSRYKEVLFSVHLLSCFQFLKLSVEIRNRS